MVLVTGLNGDNSDLLPSIFSLYIAQGSVVADVTYGRGVFWKKIDKEKYQLKATDINDGGIDFRKLPYGDESIDALILDPPYMHGGATVKDSINKCYRNQNTSHESVVRLYASGLLEAARVLKKKGVIIVKCQDEIESGKQRMTHIEIHTLMEMLGYEVIDLFVMIQKTIPAMREKYQKTARKNHSYAIVGRLRR